MLAIPICLRARGWNTPIGERMATFPEVELLTDVIGTTSERVMVGQLNVTTRAGRNMPYAIVSHPDNLARLEDIRLANLELLTAADTNPERAREIQKEYPKVLWIAGAVHGNEPSGCDAAMRMMYELGDRSDADALRVLREAVLIILPSQNPDGREDFSRRNGWGFDMNRDWFARTQEETKGKLELLAQWPPQLFIDAHEMGGTDYFFPPNADPVYVNPIRFLCWSPSLRIQHVPTLLPFSPNSARSDAPPLLSEFNTCPMLPLSLRRYRYHEVSRTALHWINELHGGSMAREFQCRGRSIMSSSIAILLY